MSGSQISSESPSVIRPLDRSIARASVENDFSQLRSPDTIQCVSPGLVVIEALASQIPNFRENLLKPAGVSQGYLIIEHTQVVLDNYLACLSGRRSPHFSMEAMLATLAVHDESKGRVSDKGQHHAATRDFIESNQEALPFTNSKGRNEVAVAKALVSCDALGRYLQSCMVESGYSPQRRAAFIQKHANDFSLDRLSEFRRMYPTFGTPNENQQARAQCIATLKLSARECNLPVTDFFELHLPYFCADTSAYVRGLTYERHPRVPDNESIRMKARFSRIPSRPSLPWVQTLPGIDWMYETTSAAEQSLGSPLTAQPERGLFKFSAPIDALVQAVWKDLEYG